MPRQKRTPSQPPQFTKAQIIADGLHALIEGQKQFANEFGLSLPRVLPSTFILIQAGNLREQLARWLDEEQAEGLSELRQVFAELITHQLALIAALDGVTLQTLQALTAKYGVTNNSMRRIRSWLLQPILKNTVEMLKTDQQLRYQKLIMPGLADSYLSILENLR